MSLPGQVLAAVRAALPGSAGGVALHEPEFRGQEWTYLKDCLDTGWVSSVGAYVDRIERDLERITGAHCSTVDDALGESLEDGSHAFENIDVSTNHDGKCTLLCTNHAA